MTREEGRALHVAYPLQLCFFQECYYHNFLFDYPTKFTNLPSISLSSEFISMSYQFLCNLNYFHLHQTRTIL